MLQVKKLQQYALLPRSCDSGYDLFTYKDISINPSERLLVGLGIACEFPRNYVARICDRSGVALKNGLHVMAGVIDSTYRGEWKVLMYNTTDVTQHLDRLTRIAQVLFYQVANFRVQEVYHLSETSRGVKGFGSTGEK